MVPSCPSPGPGQLSPHLAAPEPSLEDACDLDSVSSTNHIPGSCKNSLLWGDLIWLYHMGTKEEEEDLELEEVRGGFGCSVPTLPHSLDCLRPTSPLVSTGTLDRLAGDLILSIPNPPHTSVPPPVGLGSFYLSTIKSLS